MGWREFIVQLVDALAWPTVVLIVILLIRNKIPSLLDRAKHIKAGPVEIDLAEVERLRDALSQETAETEEKAQAQSGASEDRPTDILTDAGRSEWIRVAEISPAAALMLVHSDIDRMLRRLVIRETSQLQRPGPPAGDPGPVLAEPRSPSRPATTSTVARMARDYGLLSDDDVEALRIVSTTRNQVVHALSPSDTTKIVAALDLAVALANKIEAEERARQGNTN